jgi:hypothetical protein
MPRKNPEPPTTYALQLRHADGTSSSMALSQAPGRLYNVGDVIELSDAEWKVAEIRADEDGPTVLICDSLDRQDGR